MNDWRIVLLSLAIVALGAALIGSATNFKIGLGAWTIAATLVARTVGDDA